MKQFVFISLSFGLLTTHEAVRAQDDFTVTQPSPRIAFTSAWVTTGFDFYSVGSATLEDFRVAAPNVEILKTDFDRFNNRHAFGANSGEHFLFGAGWSVRKGQSRTYHPHLELRTLFGFTGINEWGLALEREETFAVDTLLSLSSGELLVLDSVIHRDVKATRKGNYLNLDLAVLLRSNPDRYWQWHIGSGMSIGTAHNSRIVVTERTKQERELQGDKPVEDPYNPFPDFSDYTEKTESQSVSNSKSWTGYIPFGVGINPGRAPKISERKLLLNFEIKRGLTLVNIPAFGTETFHFTSLSWGMRYRF